MPAMIIYRDGDSERGRETHGILGDKEREEAEEIGAREIKSKGETERGLDRCARWRKVGRWRNN